MSDPPAEETFACGYGAPSNQPQSQQGYNYQDFSQKRKYPENNSREGNYYPKRGGFSNNRGGNYNNNRGNYNNNRGSYNNRGNNSRGFNNSGGGNFYVNNRGNANSSNNYRKNQGAGGSDNFDPKCFYHPSMIQDPWKNL